LVLTGEPRYLLLLGFHVLVVLVLGLAAVSIRARAGANHILRGLRPTARRASAKVDDFCTKCRPCSGHPSAQHLRRPIHLFFRRPEWQPGCGIAFL